MVDEVEVSRIRRIRELPSFMSVSNIDYMRNGCEK